jgi:hypothetical protein
MRSAFFRFFAAALCFAFAAGCSSWTTETIRETFDSGVTAYDAGRYAEAYAIFKKLDGVDPAAMRNAGIMLRKGQGVTQDPKAALTILTRAANMGLATAAADVGEMLVKGEAGPPDPKAAVPWLEGAAEAGHPIAEFELGKLYEAGSVLPKDLGKARTLYTDAAARGVPGAAERLAALPAGP